MSLFGDPEQEKRIGALETQLAGFDKCLAALIKDNDELRDRLNSQEDFAHRFLAVLEKPGPGADIERMSQLARLVRRTLNIPEPPPPPLPSLPPQPYVRPEFPCQRVLYSMNRGANGAIEQPTPVERSRVIVSLDDLGKLFAEDSKWRDGLPEPVKE
jgi:hypothetical protein